MGNHDDSGARHALKRPWKMRNSAQIVEMERNNIGTTGDIGSHNHYGDNIYNHGMKTPKTLEDLVRHDAAYNSLEREQEEASVCAENTRGAVLKKLDEWALGNGDSIALLHGPAGAGKSTIAHTVAQKCDQRGCLAFSYFFSRRYGTRSDLSAFVPSLVYALSRSTGLRSIEDAVNQALQSNSGMFRQNLEGQMTSILDIIIPILSAKRSPRPMVVVIDGLDEYNENEGRIRMRHFVGLLINTVVGRLHLQILFTSRPEADIIEIFDALDISTDRVALQDFPAIEDVENYLRLEFHEIAHRRKLGADWPGPATVKSLAEKSEGIFAYASTLVRFVDNKFGDPRRNLEIAKGVHKGLDSLYIQVLEGAQSYPNSRLVIGAVAALCQPLSIEAVASLLQLSSVEDARLALRGCLSIMVIPDDGRSAIRPYHTSLQDFFKDSHRHQDRFFDSGAVHQRILDGCVDFIMPPNPRLPCMPPFSSFLSVIPAFLPLAVISILPILKSYALNHWVAHLCGILTGYDPEKIRSSRLEPRVINLLKFLRNNMEPWRGPVKKWRRSPFPHDQLRLAFQQSRNTLPEIARHLEAAFPELSKGEE
ncbi:hypothetical protein C8J56DRAFT_960990, partial [Mycena floridula]